MANDEDKIWRRDRYGDNVFPIQKTKGVKAIFMEGLSDSMMKILIAASFLSIIVEYLVNHFKNEGWILGASMLFTLVLVTILSSYSAYNCQFKLIRLRENINKKKVSVFRNSS